LIKNPLHSTTGWITRGSIPGRGRKFVSSPNRPDQLWGPPSLLSNRHQEFSPRREEVGSLKLTTHLHKNEGRCTSTHSIRLHSHGPFNPAERALYLLNKRLGGPQNQSRCFREEINFFPLPIIEPRSFASLAHKLILLPTQPSQHRC
jgi:hypothetical protein